MPDFDLDSALVSHRPSTPLCDACHQPKTLGLVYFEAGREWAMLVCGEPDCDGDWKATRWSLKIVRLIVNGQQVEPVPFVMSGRGCPNCRNFGQGCAEHQADELQNDGIHSKWECSRCNAQWEIVREVQDA